MTETEIHNDDAGSRVRPPRRGGLFSWLALGALGLLAWAFLRDRRGRGRSDHPAPRPRAAEPPVAEPPADASIAWVPGDGMSLRVCERNGDGRLSLVFVHGLGGCLEHWSAQLAALGPALRGVAFDLPGHGGSDLAVDGEILDACAGALAAVVDALALRRFVLVAHSFGALVALRYAARHAGRVLGVLLVDPSGDATRLPPDERSKLLAAARRDPRGEVGWQFRQLLLQARPEVAERVLADLEGTSEEALLAAFEASLGHSPLSDLERLVLPVRSLVTAVNQSPHSLHQLDPDLPASPLHGTGHWPMLDDPEAVNRLLDDFLDEVRAHQRAAR